MAKLSIVIVNYNVKHFLHQCLDSIFRSTGAPELEVFVVDNASVDGSMEMVKEFFPQVIAIENADNVGFAVANNQAIERATGDYTLILNPDTVLQEDTLQKCMAFLAKHPDAGGLGIKGLDGNGNYLPESKRGLPTPLVAFSKISGLIKLFPKHKVLGRYYMGHLSPDENHEVEVLVGCFMICPTSLLQSLGGFDQRYFMYGEDIDLSYRITKAGYKNYYFADSHIIHYKGESTKRGSMNYVRLFYKAMILFAQTHFNGGLAFAFRFFIYLGIYARAGISVVRRLLGAIGAPLIDAALMFTGINYIKTYWEQNHRFITGGEYPDLYTYYVQATYVLVWVCALWFGGVYHRNGRPQTVVKNMWWASLLLLSAYALLPEDLRFSRALLILSSIYSMAIAVGWRLLSDLLGFSPQFKSSIPPKRILVVADTAEYDRISGLISNSGLSVDFIGRVHPKTEGASPNSLGDIRSIHDLIPVYKANEIIFSTAHMSNGEIMQHLIDLPNHIEAKTALSESSFIVGSSSSFDNGTVYGESINALANPTNVRHKRAFDLFMALVLIATAPFWLLVYLLRKNSAPLKLLSKTPAVIWGSYTWVGYGTTATETPQDLGLPPIRTGVIPVTHYLPTSLKNDETIRHINRQYAKEYHWQSDLDQLLTALFPLKAKK